MKKIIVPFLVLTSFVILFTACPYTSSVPIDDPSVKVDKNLIGKWEKFSDQTNEHPTFFVISSIGDLKYNIIKNEYNSTDSSYTKTIYVSHISKVDNLNFLNMQQDGKGDYYLYKIELGNSEFKLYEVTDNIREKFNTSADLKAFIKKNMNLSFFYNKDEEKYIKKN
jgi:hypothetical protein